MTGGNSFPYRVQINVQGGCLSTILSPQDITILPPMNFFFGQLVYTQTFILETLKMSVPKTGCLILSYDLEF